MIGTLRMPRKHWVLGTAYFFHPRARCLGDWRYGNKGGGGGVEPWRLGFRPRLPLPHPLNARQGFGEGQRKTWGFQSWEREWREKRPGRSSAAVQGAELGNHAQVG